MSSQKITVWLRVFQALCAAEDDTDIQAVKVVKAEQKAELAEFDENIPWDEKEAETKKERDEEMSKVEQELSMLEKEVGKDRWWNVQLDFVFDVTIEMLKQALRNPDYSETELKHIYDFTGFAFA